MPNEINFNEPRSQNTFRLVVVCFCFNFFFIYLFSFLILAESRLERIKTFTFFSYFSPFLESEASFLGGEVRSRRRISQNMRVQWIVDFNELLHYSKLIFILIN
jgi:hypothetical protein